MPQERIGEGPVILVALGSNLPSPRFGDPIDVCRHALGALEASGISVVTRSRWFRTAPVPASDQPWFVNGLAAVRCDAEPEGLLRRLHGVEEAFGRVRSEPNAPRILDLDLIDYDGMVRNGEGGGPVLPHPRLHERAFVLLPLRDVAPDWRHPATGEDLATLIARLPSDQIAEPIDAPPE